MTHTILFETLSQPTGTRGKESCRWRQKSRNWATLQRHSRWIRMTWSPCFLNCKTEQKKRAAAPWRKQKWIWFWNPSPSISRWQTALQPISQRKTVRGKRWHNNLWKKGTKRKLLTSSRIKEKNSRRIGEDHSSRMPLEITMPTITMATAIPITAIPLQRSRSRLHPIRKISRRLPLSRKSR